MGAYLSEPKREKDSETCEGSDWVLGASSMQGWRANMEDAHLVAKNFGGDESCFLVGVFDGHGGQEVAKFVAKHLGEEILRNGNYSSGKVEDALRESFLKMDDMLFRPHFRKELGQWKNKGNPQNIFAQIVQLASAKEGEDDPFSGALGSALGAANEDDEEGAAGKGKNAAKYERGKNEENTISVDLKDTDPNDEVQAGCTAVVAWRKANKLIIANAGDSRAVLYKKNIALRPEEQAITANPELTTFDLLPSDEFIIMGCDGIWEIKTNQEIVDFVRARLPDCEKEGKPLSSICEEFMDSILSEDITKTEGMGCDNMTMIIIRLDKK
eukprot:g19601.t1